MLGYLQWHQQKSLIKLSMLIEYFHTQSLQNTIHIYLIYKTKSLHIFIFHETVYDLFV
jgi:hypothetical protein